MRDGLRLVGVISGSETDLFQMGPGLRVLEKAHNDGEIIWEGVKTISIH